MQALVGFINFYRHFVKKHAKVTSNRRFAKEIKREVGVYEGSSYSYRDSQTRVYKGAKFAALERGKADCCPDRWKRLRNSRNPEPIRWLRRPQTYLILLAEVHPRRANL
jgi:hypothetical protein